MKRSNFLQLVTTGTASAFVRGKAAETDSRNKTDYQELKRHTITDIQFTSVKLHYLRQVGKNARLGIHGKGQKVRVGMLTTDKGA